MPARWCRRRPWSSRWPGPRSGPASGRSADPRGGEEGRSLVLRTVGFLGIWFFAILAPTSSVVPGTTQMIVEHRMYLSLAAVMVLLVLGIYAAGPERLFREKGPRRDPGRSASPWPLAWAALTLRRNEIYRVDLALWQDTVAKRPEAARLPHNYLRGGPLRSLEGPRPRGHGGIRGEILAPGILGRSRRRTTARAAGPTWKTGHLAEALAEYGQAVAEAPGYAEAQYNFGLALLAADRPAEAILHEEIALHQRPEYPDALNTLGNALPLPPRPAPGRGAAAPYEAAACGLGPEGRGAAQQPGDRPRARREIAGGGRAAPGGGAPEARGRRDPEQSRAGAGRAGRRRTVGLARGARDLPFLRPRPPGRGPPDRPRGPGGLSQQLRRSLHLRRRGLDPGEPDDPPSLAAGAGPLAALLARADGRRPAGPQPQPRRQLCDQRAAGLELSCGQSPHPSPRRPDALRRRAADAWSASGVAGVLRCLWPPRSGGPCTRCRPSRSPTSCSGPSR